MRSDPDGTMRVAYQEIRKALDNNDRDVDVRAASFVIAMQIISRIYFDVDIYRSSVNVDFIERLPTNLPI